MLLTGKLGAELAEQLREHAGHELEVANYSGESIALECMDCGATIVEGKTDAKAD